MIVIFLKALAVLCFALLALLLLAAAAILLWGLVMSQCIRIVNRRLNKVLERIRTMPYEQAMADRSFRVWLGALKLFCLYFVRPHEWRSEQRYVRINPYLIYEPKTEPDGMRIAKLHIRSYPQNQLHQVMGILSLRDEFVAAVDKLLKDGTVDCVQGITHNKLLPQGVIDRILIPRFQALGYQVTTREMDNSYLPWIFCDFMLVYGMDWFETPRGYRHFQRMRSAVCIRITPQAAPVPETAAAGEAAPEGAENAPGETGTGKSP